MGVMACTRTDCEKIHCDYISDIGYVCSDCKDEFKEYVEREYEYTTFKESELKRLFELFMSTPKNYHKEEPEISVDDFFNLYKIN